ncbi:MAG: SDR family NAD(P)-dependent oxidoreductase [Ruminococcaceae bacterium]|nr:SDR family NAD(P)-dependent oxidoreductase [Oscillospiraceae bacterium]
MKYILVTGASGGMGRATAELLSKNGYTVFALDKKTSPDMPGIIPVEADVTDEESLNKAFDKISLVTDELFAIIHFAGIYMLNSLVEMSTSEFERILKINLEGAFLVNKTFLPLLKSDSRVVITTSELAPLDPLPFTGIYAVTKSALDKYAYSLKMELQLLGIKVSVLRAGAVDTGMIGTSMNELEKFVSNTKLYKCNADRFKRIVETVEARNIKPQKIAEKVSAILKKKSPAFAYSINRNPLLLLLNILPKRLQLFAIRQILK